LFDLGSFTFIEQQHRESFSESCGTSFLTILIGYRMVDFILPKKSGFLHEGLVNGLITACSAVLAMITSAEE
jgi:hypothetical protein